MAKKQIVDYIQENWDKGCDIKEIKEKLVNSGYSDDNIHEAIDHMFKTKKPRRKVSYKRIFLVLFLIVLVVFISYFSIGFFRNMVTQTKQPTMLPAECELEDIKQKTECFIDSTIENGNPELCTALEKTKNICLLAFVEETLDSSVCSMMDMEYYEVTCKAIIKKDPSICDKLEKADACYLKMAEFLENPLLCSKTGVFEEHCKKTLG